MVGVEEVGEVLERKEDEVSGEGVECEVRADADGSAEVAG